MNESTVSVIVIGAGSRGEVYAGYANKTQNFHIVGVADPSKSRRENLAKKHNIPDNRTYNSWEDILAEDKFADACIIATPDTVHYQPAMRAMELGYDILLEKPMSTTQKECSDLVDASKRNGSILQICHVLRYTSFYSKIHELLQSGKIGKIVNISMRENVAYYHYAHSYIRGNWNNREQSSPMILAKCSHDLDIMQWLVRGAIPKFISSFGNRSHFSLDKTFADPEIRNKIPDRCTDGCPIEDTCVYYAPRIYQDIVPLLRIAEKSSPFIERVVARSVLKVPSLKKIPPFSLVNEYYGWPINVICEDGSQESKKKALEEGPYGRCVYRIPEHNVMDHQVVNIEFESGITGSLTMHGFSHLEGRTIRIDGTRGTLIGEFLITGTQLEWHDTLTGQRKVLMQSSRDEDGHGGGDMGIMRDFHELLVRRKKGEKVESLTSAEESLISHILAFKADQARLENKVITLE